MTPADGTAAAPNGRDIRIRMYDVGFGDCFLVGFPSADHRERLVLIDCGVHFASQGGHPIADVIADIKREATSGRPDGQPRIDIVVATHRHQDHVSGFEDQDVWADVEVGEVWLPWTEDPDDEDARMILDRQSKRRELLFGFVDGAQGREWEETKGIVDNNIGYKNAEAMATLHRGFAGRPTRYFLPEVPKDGTGTRTGSMTPDLLPGVKVHILGPLRSQEAIRDMNPPADDRFLRVGRPGKRTVEADGDPLPFGAWSVEPDDYLSRIAPASGLEFTKIEVDQFVATAQTDALALAVSLEKAVNGTSLMLAFECGDQMLLFPGDAQWGTWDRAIADPAKKRLLAATTFLKVGHHGSHNATPRRYVEQILSDTVVAAFVSVAPTGIKSWSQIPRPPLLQTLGKHCDVLIRSDRYDRSLMHSRAPQQVALSRGPGGLWTELRLPTAR